MSEGLNINKNQSDQKIYEELLPQLFNLINKEEPLITNLSNITASIKESFNKISWVGFYLRKDDELFLGPFQGNTACTRIKVGSGVCGMAVLQKRTMSVEDVNKFPGHIACDSNSLSEIVVPLFQNGSIVAVLDVDSYKYSAFDKTDEIYLEKICSFICEELNFSTNILS